MDLLEDVFARRGFRLSLDHLGQKTLGAQKSGDGLMAVQWFREKKFELLTEYCQQDVEITKSLFEFGQKKGHVLFESKTGQLVRSKLSNTQHQLGLTNNQLSSTKVQLISTQQEFTSANAEPPFLDGANQPIMLISNSAATDPTWAQVQNFILADKTDQNAYVPGAYVCGDYARDVYNNAEKAGIRAAWVGIEFSANSWHACDAFKTTDKGLVFIDCTGLPVGEAGPSNCDKIVIVQLGKDYVPTSLISQPGRPSQWGDMGTVLGVQMYW